MITKEKVHKLLERWFVAEKSDEDKVIEKWLEENQPEPVVVGLADEQVDDFIDTWHKSERYYAVGVYRDWAKTQNFTQLNTLLNYQLDEARREIKRVETLNAELLKSQQFTPDWDNAPKWANWITINEDGRCEYHEKMPEQIKSQDVDSVCGFWRSYGKRQLVLFNKNWMETIQPRPTPPALVEVGQVWMHKKTMNEYEISNKGQIKVNNEWIDSITYQYSKTEFYTRTLSDFLAKFERVL